MEKAGAEPETQQCAEPDGNRPEHEAGERKGNDWRQLGVLLLGTSFFGNGTLGITKGLLSVVLTSMGFTGVQMGLITGARGFKAVADFPAGYLSDRYGRKKIAYAGQIILVIAHWIMGLGNSFWMMLTGRIFHGAGAGFNAGAATFGAADLFKKSRGLGQGILETANYGSQTIFAATAGYIALRYGPRAAFLILGLAPIFGMLITWRYLKEPRDSDGGGHHHVSGKDALLFIRSLLTNPCMLSVFFAGLLTKFADDGVLTLVLPLWIKEHSISPPVLALIITVTHGTFASFVALAGWFSDLKGRKTAMVAGTLLFSLSCLAMPYAGTAAAILPVAMLISLGNAIIYPSAPAAAADVSPDHLRGTGMSAYKLIHDLGVFAGPFTLGCIIDSFGKAMAFRVAAVVGIICCLSLLFFYRDNLEKKSVRA